MGKISEDRYLSENTVKQRYLLFYSGRNFKIYL